MKRPNTQIIINKYIESLIAHAETSGDGKLEYAMGYVGATLKSLHLQIFELEVLVEDTKRMNKLAGKPCSGAVLLA